MKLQDDAEADNSEVQAQDMDDKEFLVDLDIKCESTHGEPRTMSYLLSEFVASCHGERSGASLELQAVIVIAYEEHFQG